jgi:hypothetical protein
MTAVVWVHEEALRADHPVFQAAPDARSVFCWDKVYLDHANIGLNRQLFIYECLVPLDVDIFAGTAASIFAALAKQDAITEIFMADTPNQLLHAELDRVGQAVPGSRVTLVPDRPFVQIDTPPELGRFHRYWNKARKAALRPSGR